jgi:hypothetical protein
MAEAGFQSFVGSLLHVGAGKVSRIESIRISTVSLHYGKTGSTESSSVLGADRSIIEPGCTTSPQKS